jgi:hypothetical protein
MLLLAGSPQLWTYVAGVAPGDSRSQGDDRGVPAFPMARRASSTGRVFASGGLRFRLNSWFDIQPAGGAFETGLPNRMPVDLAYSIRTGTSTRPGHEAQDRSFETQSPGRTIRSGSRAAIRESITTTIFGPISSRGLLPAYYPADDIVCAVPAKPLANLVTAGERPGEGTPTHPWVLEPDVAARRRRTASRAANTLPRRGARWPSMAPPGRPIAVPVNSDPGMARLQEQQPDGVNLI